ncbi:MAG: DUF4232 domain-containing protein [Gaiellaceae bacterium]
MTLPRRSLPLFVIVPVAMLLATACGSSGGSKTKLLSCASSQLNVSISLQGATGGLLGEVQVENGGDAKCTLSGRPEGTVSARGGKKIAAVQKALQPAWAQSGAAKPENWPLVVLEPGGKAKVLVRLENWCSNYGKKATLAFVLPTGTVSAATEVSGACSAPGEPVRLAVGPFEPAG